MPTEREHSKYTDLGHDVAKYKHDHSNFRLHFLNSIDQVRQCPVCGAIRIGVILLAMYGVYSLLF